MRKTVLKAIALGLMITASAQAATNVIDFNSDPAATGLYAEAPGASSSEWRPNGGFTGAAGDGYLSITDARGSQRSVLVFKDLESGLVVKSFIFECDLRIGGGTDRPADGFSLNFVSDSDPIVTNFSPFAGTDGETDLPEQGSLTGLGIGFDTWESGAMNNGTVTDTVGLSVLVDGVLITQLPVPLQAGNTYLPTMPLPGQQGTQYTYDEVPYRNLATNNVNYAKSMQTGALNTTDDLNADGVVDANDANAAQPPFGDPTWDLWIKNLKWEHFKAEVSEAGMVKITWKGNEITPPGGISSGFSPRPGRLVFGGRTGGAWEVHHVDNIRLVTVPADTVVIGPVQGGPLGFKITVIDSGPAIADTNTLVVKFNNTTITPTFVSKNGSTTTIAYNQSPNNPLAIGSSNAVQVTINDTRGIQASDIRSFIVGFYNIIPTAYVVPPASVDTTKPGFEIHPYQTFAAQPNNLDWTEKQLFGTYGANIADLTAATNGVPGLGNTGFIDRTTVINYSIDGDGDFIVDPAGNFTVNNGNQDEQLPGIPGPVPPGTDVNANSTEEVFTWLWLPAGAYTMGVNSDDGFKVSTGFNPKNYFSLNLGQFNGGRGASDTLFTFVVQQDGYYPFRLLWENGGGGANVEWFTLNPDGSKAMINDTNNATSIKGYRSGQALPAYVNFVVPSPGDTAARPDVVLAKLTDAATTISSATISLNGGPATAGTKSGAVTTAAVPISGLLPSGSTNTATLVWTDGTRTSTNTWTFVTAVFRAVPTTLVSPIGSGDATKPGFTVQANQVDNAAPHNNTENNNEAAESQLLGLYGPNIATLGAGGAGNGQVYLSNDVFAVTNVINMDRGANDGSNGEDGNFRAGNGHPEDQFPGITGGGGGALFESIAMGFQTYIEFPTAGFYTLAVSSDDNFRVSVGESAPPAILTISGPTNTALPVLCMGKNPGEADGGRAVFGTLPPVNPINAPIVYLTPGGINDPGPYPDVTGKIALLDRNGSNLGTTSTGGKAKAAQDRGAVAVIFTTPGDGSYGFYAGATRTDINIPVLSIPDSPTANLLRSYLTNAVVVNGTVKGDPNFFLGGADYGKGASDVPFNFQIAQAGVYPIRLVFHQGGGGANVEFFSVQADGSRVLVNDSTTSGSLKAFRARTSVTRPQLTATVSGGNITVNWTGGGTLESATALSSPPGSITWTSTGNSSGSFTEPKTGTAKFYRVVR